MFCRGLERQEWKDAWLGKVEGWIWEEDRRLRSERETSGLEALMMSQLHEEEGPRVVRVQLLKKSWKKSWKRKTAVRPVCLSCIRDKLWRP